MNYRKQTISEITKIYAGTRLGRQELYWDFQRWTGPEGSGMPVIAKTNLLQYISDLKDPNDEFSECVKDKVEDKAECIDIYSSIAWNIPTSWSVYAYRW